MPPKKRKLVSLSTKLDILQGIDAGESIRVVAERLGVSKGIVQAAKKSRQSIGDVVLEERLPEFDISADAEQLLENVIAEYEAEVNEVDLESEDEVPDDRQIDVEVPPRPTPITTTSEAISACSSLLKYCRENSLVEEESFLLAFVSQLRLKREKNRSQTDLKRFFNVLEK